MNILRAIRNPRVLLSALGDRDIESLGQCPYCRASRKVNDTGDGPWVQCECEGPGEPLLVVVARLMEVGPDEVLVQAPDLRGVTATAALEAADAVTRAATTHAAVWELWKRARERFARQRNSRLVRDQWDGELRYAGVLTLDLLGSYVQSRVLATLGLIDESELPQLLAALGQARWERHSRERAPERVVQPRRLGGPMILWPVEDGPGHIAGFLIAARSLEEDQVGLWAVLRRQLYGWRGGFVFWSLATIRPADRAYLMTCPWLAERLNAHWLAIGSHEAGPSRPVLVPCGIGLGQPDCPWRLEVAGDHPAAAALAQLLELPRRPVAMPGPGQQQWLQAGPLLRRLAKAEPVDPQPPQPTGEEPPPRSGREWHRLGVKLDDAEGVLRAYSSGALLADCVPLVRYVYRGRVGSWRLAVVEVQRGGLSAVGLATMRELESDPAAVIRRVAHEGGLGTPTVRAWRQTLVRAMLKAGGHRIVTVVDRVGWDAGRGSFAFPALELESDGPRALSAWAPAPLPCERWRPDDPVVLPHDLGHWAALAGLLYVVTRPMNDTELRVPDLLVLSPDAVVEELARALGCLRVLAGINASATTEYWPAQRWPLYTAGPVRYQYWAVAPDTRLVFPAVGQPIFCSADPADALKAAIVRRAVLVDAGLEPDRSWSASGLVLRLLQALMAQRRPFGMEAVLDILVRVGGLDPTELPRVRERIALTDAEALALAMRVQKEATGSPRIPYQSLLRDLPILERRLVRTRLVELGYWERGAPE